MSSNLIDMLVKRFSIKGMVQKKRTGLESKALALERPNLKVWTPANKKMALFY
jgi:hypothetical protein